MKKQEMINQLRDRIAYNEDQQGYYEKKHADEFVVKGQVHSIWSEMADWYKGKIVGLRQAIEMIEEVA